MSDENKFKDQQRLILSQRLVETGEKERLKESLRQKLCECGWRDEIKSYCRTLIRQKGVDNITVDALMQNITAKGRASVPNEVKAELLRKIRKFLATQ